MGETLRIAFVYDVIYPWVKGGVERRIHELAVRLARKHEVHVYGYKHWDGAPEIERNGVIYHGIVSPGSIYLAGKRNPLPMLRLASNLRKRLPELRKYDVVDVQNLFYPGAFVLRALPNALLTWHESWGNYWFSYFGPAGIPGWAVERLLSDYRLHLAVSRKTQLDLLQVGVPSRVVPNGVDLERTDRVKPSECESDLVFVGRLVKDKNLELAIRAVAGLVDDFPHVRFSIIGDGPERKNLENLAMKLGIRKNVDFLGRLESWEDVISLLKASKVFAFPSRREGFGMAVLEAMAAGVPPVVLDSPMNAARFLVNEKSGLVLSGDRFADGLRLLLSENNLGKKLGRNARKKAEMFDWGKIVGTLAGIYLEFTSSLPR
ncbi:glycosyltransferase family 4 protein [Thermococcus sp. Bubb.Bath]|uniref:glycosyltransferase family 4 protein n=1 Tax=Thermococcus sp. Bubb.Bath TaxID=1638242 RepID=UPI0014394F3B|nr:glycosyltransferase family 4 protein [Thermococcus sp. Bubb.Bath]NJF25136.1 glycosyltransferase family 1 protein [Thermococcus sp. Bubb.Bath]